MSAHHYVESCRTLKSHPLNNFINSFLDIFQCQDVKERKRIFNTSLLTPSHTEISWKNMVQSRRQALKLYSARKHCILKNKNERKNNFSWSSRPSECNQIEASLSPNSRSSKIGEAPTGFLSFAESSTMMEMNRINCNVTRAYLTHIHGAMNSRLWLITPMQRDTEKIESRHKIVPRMYNLSTSPETKKRW